MAKPNYRQQKKQREEATKKKNQEKQMKRMKASEDAKASAIEPGATPDPKGAA
jgi:hypothetical protein